MKERLITSEGLVKLNKRFKDLLKEKEHWVKEKQIAAEHGDRSENAEYHAAKENIRNIDKQLFKLEKIINTAVPMETKNRSNDKIVFGSIVDLSVNENEELTVKLVGTNELDLYPSERYMAISVLSPMGQALIGKELDDSFTLRGKEYIIEDIE